MIRPTAFAAAMAAALISGRAAHAGPPEGATSPPQEIRRNVISTNPVRYAILHFQLEYERVVADRFTLFVAPIYFHHATWYPFAPSHDRTADGFGVDFGARYVFGEAPRGAFVGPILSAYRTRVQRSNAETLSGYVLSPGVQGGYTWLVDWLLLSAGVGLSYGFATERATDGTSKAAELPHRGLWVNFRANVGFAF
jgi:hypothetical protein